MSASFLEVLDRAYHTGLICKEKEWDVKVIPTKITEKLKEYGLEGTCTPENPVNTDDDLADEFWQAGFDLAVDVGMLCRETERVIKFTEDELKEALRSARSEVNFGKGEDRVIFRARKPEDRKTPTARFGPCGIAFDENLVIPVIQSCAQYRVIDMVINPCLTKMYGWEVRAGTPFETLAAAYEISMVREAYRRAGRPDLPYCGLVVSATEYGNLGGFGMPNGPNLAVLLTISELKTSVRLLHKTAHDVFNFKGLSMGCSWSMIGGYAGPPEGAALGAIAIMVLNRAVHFMTSSGGIVMDIRYSGDAGEKAIWANSIAHQAQSRNTDILTAGFTSQTSGPCTPELLYETAAIVLNDVASGVALELGTRPTGCRYPNYASGLENKFAAEVTKYSAGMKRADVNEIVKVLTPNYRDKLEHPPKGKSFVECTDLKTLKPTKEWLDIYNGVKEELIQLGVPLPT